MVASYVDERYAPVRAEVTEFDLPVRGTIPEWLDGRYLRNGPNPIAQVRPDEYNWFTGDGMVHGIRISGGRALWYRNRWVDSEVTSRALHRSAPPEHGRSPLHGPSANTNVIGFAGRTLALVEAGVACAELSYDLDTVDVCDFDGTVRGGYTAHPIEEPGTGELHAVSYHFGRGDTVLYTVIGPDGRLRRKLPIRVGGSPMMHAFSLTPDFVVIYDLPVTFDVRSAVTANIARPLRPFAALALSATIGRVRLPRPVLNRVPATRAGSFPYRWDHRYPPRVGLVPRRGDPTPMWLDVEPCYVFHPVNATSEGGKVVVDLVVHERVFDADRTGPSEGRPRLERWHLDPLVSSRVRRTRLGDENVEFPRFDERYTASLHHDCWLVVGSDDLSGEHRLVRSDRAHGIQAMRDFGPRSAVGEFVFHPEAPDSPEGHGVVMGLVTNLAENSTELRILDARTLEDQASIALPRRVPAGFHGNWVPDAAATL
ncbi:carotenoid oxygenase [Prescottella equi]|uniref:carotenoid oxygenase family protein n=1 Tax=Rhodococcus hoagii TaxID=43767 RepID=UPI000A0F7881|nr:carotenoid oxygenase family protein [Prescottella equi]ORL37642.1 carotenoid oxygenase [Prescottella equi]ORL99821.1 carotenoid oxygenase [Prescottella equi]ORM21998.1 carotenoid oxygenase [Prescottella equi]QDP10032.1 carotenoid oxygenase [Prescottella equi]